MDRKWEKLRRWQALMMGIYTDTGEVVLIDVASPAVTADSIYVNAQEHFSKEELDAMPYFGGV